MGVNRSYWTYVTPATFAARMRRVSVAAPTLLFALSASALLAKQSYRRVNLSEEDAATDDRIDRRAYVALPDGRMALVHPAINAHLTFGHTVKSLKEFFNPMP